MMRKIFVLIPAGDALALGACTTPHDRAVGDFLTALDSGDAEMVEEHIDFPAVRDNLRADVRASTAEEMTGTNELIAEIGTALVHTVIDALIDNLHTPQTLARASQGGDAASDWNEYATEQIGPDRFDAVFPTDAGEEGRLQFRNEDKPWKLFRIPFAGPSQPVDQENGQ